MQPPLGKFNDPTDEKSQPAVAEKKVQQPCAIAAVLVVDDEHLVRIMVQLCLERNGFDVWIARNCQEAVDIHRQHREEIDIVLIDVHMPGLDELQALKGMRELNPNILACFMSSDTGADKWEDLLRRGGAYSIAKPFRLDELANVLRLMVQGVPAAVLPSGRAGQK